MRECVSYDVAKTTIHTGFVYVTCRATDEEYMYIYVLAHKTKESGKSRVQSSTLRSYTYTHIIVYSIHK